MPAIVNETYRLRDEIAFLGALLGETIRDIDGEEAFALVEEIRRLAWDRRNGVADAETRLLERIASLDQEQLRSTIRAYTIFLDLLNLSEDRQRVRVLAERANSAYPNPRPESILHAIHELRESGVSSDSVQEVVNGLGVELVFTAHPTEAKRRSIREKLRQLRRLLGQRDLTSSPEDLSKLQLAMKSELAKLWLTDFIRPWRPSVMQEVERGLSFKPVLWEEIPMICSQLREALLKEYGSRFEQRCPPIACGSWIGGDRDGHPGVTAEVTTQTLSWLRDSAIDFHLKECRRLFGGLSLSVRQLKNAERLGEAIERARSHWPQLIDAQSSIPPGEWCRQWLTTIEWRLRQTRRVSLTSVPDEIEGAYDNIETLEQDIRLMADVIAQSPGGELIVQDVESWLDRVAVFGFQLAKLDIRQDSRVYAEVINELLRHSNIHSSPETLDEAGRCQVLCDSLNRVVQLDDPNHSEMTQETLELFRLLHRVFATFGPDAIGGHVISMTHYLSDMLTVLWLWNHTRDGDRSTVDHSLKIVPLFETISDLERAPKILGEMISRPTFRDHIAAQSNEQMIMLGYSDSTKDGGYLSACWSLHLAQQELTRIADDAGISLIFFHGRGGSLGRGGGPAARSILSLPRGTFHGSLRITEQGEVLADRYDDPAIARRHLEQLVWSSLMAAAKRHERESDSWGGLMQTLADTSFKAYRQLVESDRFVEFFRTVTPISEIEQLPIGSRPARRRGGNSLSDLRAIPWVFSWTQCRCLIPAWYGLGTALAQLSRDPEHATGLREMYHHWNSFRAIIDNAELALAKADLGIMQLYFSLAKDDSDPQRNEAMKKIADSIVQEYEQAVDGVLALTGRTELLDGTPWLKESIRVRNRYIDPLNLIQIELLRRSHALAEDQHDEELRHVSRLAINGLASGMRTSG